jgi:diguanylate cyclase
MSSAIDALLRSPDAYMWARKAIEAMEAYRVWPTALNFELWLHYVSSKDSDVAAKIGSVLNSGQRFTDQVGEKIAAEHLPSARLSEEILDAGKSLTEELNSVSRALESARESSEAYGQQLASASKTLGEDGADAIRTMVETLNSATDRVREENKALETQLADTNEELGRLREHLEQVRHDSMTDTLTDLANRKAFDEALERSQADADKDGQPLSLAILDIDHFKVFNDTWGHQTGDQVIRYVASVLARAATGQRTAARYGGEEFALILPGEAAEAAQAVIEAARVEISSRILKRRSTNEDLGAITISSGIAQQQPGDEPADLIERADAALYCSKRDGRNRTTLAPPSSKTGAANTRAA